MLLYPTSAVCPRRQVCLPKFLGLRRQGGPPLLREIIATLGAFGDEAARARAHLVPTVPVGRRCSDDEDVEDDDDEPRHEIHNPGLAIVKLHNSQTRPIIIISATQARLYLQHPQPKHEFHFLFLFPTS